MLETACKRLNVKFVKVVGDMPTRWNSSYYMIQTVLRLQEPLRSVISMDDDLKQYTLKEEEWATMYHLSNLLMVKAVH